MVTDFNGHFYLFMHMFEEFENLQQQHFLSKYSGDAFKRPGGNSGFIQAQSVLRVAFYMRRCSINLIILFDQFGYDAASRNSLAGK